MLPLFTEVRGRGILRSSDAGSCIDRRREPRGWRLRPARSVRGSLRVVVLDRYAAGRIAPAPQWFRCCTVRERAVLEKPHTPGPIAPGAQESVQRPWWRRMLGG